MISVDDACGIHTDKAVMPGFVGVACDIDLIGRVTENEAELPSVFL